MYWRNKVIVAKKEVTYGVDAAPLAANVIRASDVSLNPLEAKTVARQPVQPYMGAGTSYLVGKHVKLDFTVEAAGSGDAANAVAYAELLLACGLAETVDATPGSEKVVYTPVSGSFDSLSMYFYVDGVLHKLLGARGNVVYDMKAEDVPVWRFSFMGLFVAPSAAAVPAVDFSAFKDPVIPTKATLPTITLHGYAAKLRSLSVDLGAKVEYRPLCNDESIIITDRETTGKINIEEPAIGTKDFWVAATGHTRGVLQLVHGIAAGAIVGIDAPKVQILGISRTEAQGITHLDMNLSFKPDAGNDEVEFTTK